MRRLRRYLLISGIVIIVFTIFGFFGVPPLLKSVLVKELSQRLNRDVTIGQIKVNPYTLSVRVNDFVVKEPSGKQTFVSLDEFFVNFEIVSAIRQALIIKELKVKKPFVNVIRYENLAYNFSDLLRKDEPVSGKKGKEKPLRFSLNNITIQDGTVEFSDEPKQKKHRISELNIGIPFLSNFPAHINTFVTPEFSAKINDSPYKLEGETKPFADSRESIVKVKIRDLNIPHYLAYLPFKPNFTIPSAFMDADIELSFLERRGKYPSLTISGDIALKNIELDDSKRTPLIKLPLLSVTFSGSEPLEKKIRLSKIYIQSPEVEVRRDRNGTINLQNLLPHTKDLSANSKPENDKASQWLFEIDLLELSNGKLTFFDLSGNSPFKTVLFPLDSKIERFSTAKGRQAHYLISATTETKEMVKLEGEFSVEPKVAEGAVSVKNITIKKYSPYYADRVLFSIEDGRLDFSTHYRYEKKEERHLISLTEMGATISSLRLRRPDEKEDFFIVPVLSLRDTHLDITGRKLRIGEFSTQRGTLTLTRLPNGDFDVAKLINTATLDHSEDKLRAGKMQEKPWLLTVNRILLDQYTIRMTDRKTPVPASLLGERIAFKAEELSTAKNATGSFSLSLTLNKKGTISVAGTISLDPISSQGSIEVKDISINEYSPYYLERILFDIVDGTLGFNTRYRYSRNGSEHEIRLSEIGVAIEKLKLRKREEKDLFADIPKLSVRNGALDLPARQLALGELSSQNGNLHVKRSRNGKFNLQTLFPESRAAENASSEIPAPPKHVQQMIPKAPNVPWTIKVGKMSLDRYSIEMEDESAAEPVTLVAEQLNLKAENLSTEKNRKGNISLGFRLNRKGIVSVAGSAGMNPLSGDFAARLEGIDIRSLQGYFTDKVRIIVQDGSISANGSLALSHIEGKGFRLTYAGAASLNNFASVDKHKAEDFLKWESLSFEGMDIGYNPVQVNIKGISLTNFYARVIIFPDGTVNLQKILKKENASPTPDKGLTSNKKSEPPQQEQKSIRIDTVTIQNGRINFTDNYIKPNYSAELCELGGRISGLTSEEKKVGEVEVRGKLNSFAPLEIVGKINPFSKDLLVDLNVRFMDIDLSPLTPYSGKYIGYTIQKGKLTLDLKYLIVKRKLDAQNRIFFDQLTLGERIESPDATKLPVKLGIALLKDRKGEINLDIPVTGSLDDPKFSIFRIVLQIIGNLLVKAATSPFALLGSIFGAGEQLDYIEFDYGSAKIAGESEKKLNTLIKILQDRPEIKLEIEGHVDVEKDKEGLKQLFFERKLKAQKLKEMVKKGLSPVTLDDVKIDPKDYAKYLKLAYKEEKFPKPKTFLGFDKDIPPAEMEKLMMTHINVTEDNLRFLAAQRAQNVKEQLIRLGQIPPERLFIIEPKTLEPEKKENVRSSRVNFKIE